MENLGKKAESLISLKEKGIFQQGLVILPELPEYSELEERMKLEGFLDGEDLAVRFSSPEKNINLPRSIILDSFEKIHEFIKNNIEEKTAAIVHRFAIPEFSGTIIKIGDKSYISLINGAWETSSSKSCDNIIVSNKVAKIQFDPKEKECLFVNRDKLERKPVMNGKETLSKKIADILKKIGELSLEQNILYEFILTPEKDLVIMEFKESTNFNEFNFEQNSKRIFKIESFEDITSWDKKTDLLISVPLGRDEDLEFIKLIEKIKPHKEKVFVSYGITSHPCILLRENGIGTFPESEDKEIFEIEL